MIKFKAPVTAFLRNGMSKAIGLNIHHSIYSNEIVLKVVNSKGLETTGRISTPADYSTICDIINELELIKQRIRTSR